MANARNTRLRFLESQIEESLKSLLQEGSKYSHILEKLYHRNRSAYSDIQKVLCIMDNYSRHKTALKEDTGMMNEAIDSLMEYYYEETETEDDEETISGDEIYDSYAKWVNLLSSVIGDRKNVLTRLERTFLEIIESYSKLIMLQSELNGHLQNYCGRVVTVLKQTTDMENRLANQFREKQKKLGEILVHITKMRKFFWGDNTSATETV